MPSSKLLKERIESIQDTMKITNAMYLISSSKLRKARKNYQNVSPYFNRMRDTISRVVPHLPEEPVHPFFHDRTNEKSNPRRAYLVLTADKGMAGAFNQNILRFLKEHADENDRFYVIGQVGYRALQPAPKGFGDPSGEVELFPDAWTVFEQTAPIYMHGMIFGAMTESYCAEQSARMTAMDSATKSANDMIRDLQLEYNRTRQGSITQEITEIIGGAAAVQKRD